MACHDYDLPSLLKVISEQCDRAANQSMRTLDVTASQIRALVYLYKEDGPRTQKEIRNDLQVSQPSVVGLVQRLLQKGYVNTFPHPTDGRSTMVELTPLGRETCRKAEAHICHGQTLMTQGMTEEEVATLLHLLKRVHQNLSDAERPPQKGENALHDQNADPSDQAV
ncbi:MAG: MarR family transcriptional regulator [Clostridia bacterium]|nr:MarR family transcriptional regulator [Clostridia bacterium]